MRRIILNLSLLAFAAAPVAAYAVPTEILTLTETSGGSNVYTYLFPSAPTSVTVDGIDGFDLSVMASTNGSAYTPGTLTFADAIGGGGVFDQVTQIGVFTPVLFGGTLSAPIFTTSLSGTGAAGYDANPEDNFVFSYSLAPYATGSPTPEPSSLVLLGTGAIGLLGAFRRRFVA